MNTRLTIPQKPHEGSALLVLMGFIAVIAITLASLMAWTSSESILVSRRGGLIDSLYGSEAATRRSMAQVRVLFNTLANNLYVTGNYVAATDAQLAAIAGPTTVPALNNAYTYTGVTNAYTTGTSTNRYVTGVVATNSPTLANWAGLTASSATIRCSATAASKTSRYAVPAHISQDFIVALLPVFQFAVFFNTDMEIFNGPTMNINGRLHANGTLYYAPAAALSVQSTLTTSADIERGLKLWNTSKPTAVTSASNYSYYYDQTPTSWTTSQRNALAQTLYEHDPVNWVSTPPTGGASSYGTADFNVKHATSPSMVNFKTSSSPLTYFDSESSGWAGGATTRWGGGVKSVSQGMTTLPPPLAASTLESVTSDPASGYYDPANPYHLMIDHPVLDANGVSTETSDIQATKMAYSSSLLIQRSGTNVTFRIRGSDGAFHKVTNLRNAANIVPTATTTLRDQREYLQNGSVKMTVTEFDVGAFYGTSGGATVGATDADGVWQNSSNAPITTDANGVGFSPVPFDGTIYIYDDDYSSTRKPAIRVKNGATIYNKDSDNTKNNGLSIVTENPVYVWGNFNADGTITTAPEKGNETVPPAMIAADVISVLSTSWVNGDNDPGGSAAASNYFNRQGTGNTEINAAVLAGVNASSQSAISSSFDGTTGGLNNFPRFLENWNSTFKYSGSLVSLWYGKQSTSTYRGAGGTWGVFSAPTRDWAFNTDFLNPNKLPRLTPIVRQFVTANWNNQ